MTIHEPLHAVYARMAPSKRQRRRTAWIITASAIAGAAAAIGYVVWRLGRLL